MTIRITAREASILIVSGIIIGMVLAAFYAADAGQLALFVTSSYAKLVAALAAYVVGAMGVYIIEGRQ